MFSLIIIIVVLIIMAYTLFDWLIHRALLTNHNDRYILVTGCDSGFGFKIAAELDQLGKYGGLL